MSIKTALLSAATLSLSAPAYAQIIENDILDPDTITVDGTRLNQTATEVGSSVSLITEENLETLNLDFVIDALATAPGVTINQNGGFGGAASVRIRGASSGQTLVLIDGVPVGDPSVTDGGFDFAFLDADNIERVEILKGPQSTFWGSDAIGGVVSVTTKQPEPGFGGSAFAEYGSYDTVRGGASLEAANDTGDFRLSATGISSDGISKADADNGNPEADGYESVTLAAKGGLNLPNSARLEGNLLFTDAETDLDSFVFGAQGNVADGDESSESETVSGNVTLQLPLFAGQIENLFLLGYSDIERENFANGAPSFSAEGERTILRYQGTVSINRMNTLSLGAETEDTTADGNDADTDSVFALYEFKPVETLTLTGGLRYDDDSRYGSETTARVAAAWNPTEQITLRSSWGEGFKAPSIFQTTYICTFCGLSAPNANLQPETSEAFDVGVEWRSSDQRTQAGITYFDQDTENLIDFSFTAGYDNIAEVKSQGVEIFASYALTDWLSVGGNYTYIDADDGAGNTLSRLPEHSGNVSLSIKPDGPFSGAVIVRYNGEEANTDGTTLDNWTRVDLTGRYDLNDRVELFGRVENLLDEDYQQILGYGTPGLSGSMGLRLRY